MSSSQLVTQPPKSITLNTRLLPALVGLLVLLQLVVPYRGWSILLVGLGGVWLMAYLWARSLAHGLHLRREIRFGWTHVGDQMLERFSLANEGWAPAVWVELVDHSTLPSYGGSRVISVSGYDILRWHREAVCTRRGLFTLGPTSLRTGDPFGIYAVHRHEPASATLMVMPPIVPLPTIDVAPGGRVGDARPRVNVLERTVSSARVREYLPGDSLRWVHWRTSARRDSLFIRTFDSTSAGDSWIILDMDRGAQAGRGENSTEEHGVILAASLADLDLRAGRSVGLLTLAGNDDLVWLPPQAGEGQRWEILRALAVAGPGASSLADLLTRARPWSRQLASLIIITPAIQGGWVEALLPLARRGAVPTVLLLDVASFGGTGDVTPTASLLSDMGIAHYVIQRDLLERPEARPDPQHDWRRVRLQDDPWKVLA